MDSIFRGATYTWERLIGEYIQYKLLMTSTDRSKDGPWPREPSADPDDHSAVVCQGNPAPQDSQAARFRCVQTAPIASLNVCTYGKLVVINHLHNSLTDTSKSIKKLYKASESDC